MICDIIDLTKEDEGRSAHGKETDERKGLRID